MEIKILGGGCPRCERLEKVAREAAQELNIDAVFTKVKNMNAILQYNIAGTPALVIDEQVQSAGRIPAKEEIIAWLQSPIKKPNHLITKLLTFLKEIIVTIIKLKGN